MRVSDSAVYSSMKKRLTSARAELNRKQEQVASGLRVQKPSDDPVAAASARRQKSKQALSESGMKAADLATTHLLGADEAMAAAYDGLLSAREIALQASSTTLGPEQRADLAHQVQAIREQMVVYGNTEVAGTFVFGGHRSGEPPFTEAGDFVGDSSVREVQVYPNVRVSSSISGADVFGTGASDGIFAALDALEAGLTSNDRSAIRGTLEHFSTNESRFLSARAELGAMIDNVQAAHSVADRYGHAAKLESARLTEAEEISAIADMVKARTSYEAAVAVAQQIQVAGLVQSRG